MLSQFVFVLKIANQMSFYPFVLHEISVLIELILGHLRYLLTDVPPQPNSPPDYVLDLGHTRCQNVDIWFGSRKRKETRPPLDCSNGKLVPRSHIIE